MGLFVYRETIHCATKSTMGMVPTDKRDEVPTVWEAYPAFSPVMCSVFCWQTARLKRLRNLREPIRHKRGEIYGAQKENALL